MRLPLTALLIPVLAAAQGAQETGTIGGVVRDAGTKTPIAGATVWVNRASGGAKATTDDEGRFSLSGLKPGQHRITTELPAKLTSRGLGGFTTASRLITLAAGQQLMSVDFSMRTAGTITGRVTDQNEEPVQDAWVILVAREYSAGALRYVYASIASTDDQGQYEMRVQPGRAFLLMAIKREMKLNAISEAPQEIKLRKQAMVPTFYPGTPSPEGAQPLILRTGEVRGGVDLRLLRSPAYCIDGVLRGSQGPEALQFIIAGRQVTSGYSGDGGLFAASPRGTAGADGRIRICGLSSGEYDLTAYSSDAAGEPGSYGSAVVSITDSDVRGLTVTARPLMAVTGEAIWDGPAPDPPVTAKLTIGLRPITRAPFRSEVNYQRVDIPGAFKFDTVLLDDYMVQVNGVPPTAYLKEVTYSGRSVRFEPLRVGSAIGDAGLRIVLGLDGATAGVKIVDRDSNAVADARVILIPETVMSEAALASAMIVGQTDQRGMWTSPRLAPGKYLALARRDPPDKSPETIRALFLARRSAKELDLAPKSSADVTLELSAVD